ncbi:glycerol acyltransferase [Bizionia argentinensis JUB59]|uniref:Glycerol acyltransferase n=1 Tax=Bizionia argentinensis JUB59 TaxID=1046627 RepID=G2EAV6_9FLAO|nr:glycerol acyltransferase [Bizionia argentinensis JUB59]
MQLALFFYYRRINLKQRKNVPKNEPVILVSNHNSALMDALLVASQSGRYMYFLTRASVFKKPFVNALLRSFNMLPVYRVRDGWSSISNNKAIFETCSLGLFNNGAVALFPEGNHHLNRTVRNLSKGFTRIVFETLDSYPTTDLKIIPIGLNYEKADAFADSVSIYFGKPIYGQNYMENDRNAGTNRLKADVRKAITQLTTHIPADNYEETIQKLELLGADFLDPQAVNNCVKSDFENCSFTKARKLKSIKAAFKFLMITFLIAPYAIWKGLAEPKIKDAEFIATFRFAIVMTLVPIWLLIITVILLFTLGLQWALIYLVSALCVSLLAVKL